MQKLSLLKKIPFVVFVAVLLLAFWVGRSVAPRSVIEEISRDVQTADDGSLYFTQKGKPVPVTGLVPAAESKLLAWGADPESAPPEVKQEFVVRSTTNAEGELQTNYSEVHMRHHYFYWSLLPALVAIFLCWTTREPVTALFGGVAAGALVLGRYHIIDGVLLQNMADEKAAGVILLYLWLLGGLLGIWSRTGAAQAFAEYMSRKYVRGPKTARLVAWFLGIVFFQGGTVSTVLVGSTVKPLSDQHQISHEELSYIVDSTASPIASQIPLNAWPGYVQALIFVPGVAWLATETDRIGFFLHSILFCWYATFAVLQTFLFCIDKAPWVSRKMKTAIERSRTTGELNAPDAEPMAASELSGSNVPEGYKPNALEFLIPLALLIGIAIGTFIVSGSPDIRLAFGAAVLLAGVTALAKGMKMSELMGGIGNGLKGVVMGSVVLLLAICLGMITKELGAGIYAAQKLSSIPVWILPVTLQLLTMGIAFSTGTSWGTYAVAFPLAMPLAWQIAQTNNVDNPYLLMMLCFAAVMDGSVFGDQCSPISDTTVLSSMCTGCDLMDHVKTQMPQAMLAAAAAGTLWTIVALIFV